MCDQTEKDKCLAESGENLAWACANCPKKRAEDINEYTWKMLKIRRLKLAGYPFGPDDLSIEEWEDLGRVEEWLSSRIVEMP